MLSSLWLNSIHTCIFVGVLIFSYLKDLVHNNLKAHEKQKQNNFEGARKKRKKVKLCCNPSANK